VAQAERAEPLAGRDPVTHAAQQRGGDDTACARRATLQPYPGAAAVTLGQPETVAARAGAVRDGPEPVVHDAPPFDRIDHDLGNRAVQNLLALRLGNRIFEPLPAREHVASVQITVSEVLGETRRRGAARRAGHGAA
jgi:hypothetical protein